MNELQSLSDSTVAEIAQELWVRHLMSDGRRAMELVRCVHATGNDAYPKAVEYVRNRFQQLGIPFNDLKSK